MTQHDQLFLEFEQFARLGNKRNALMQHISDRLHHQLTRYNWVGFYVIDPADPNVLVIGPYSGTHTPHVRIPLIQGLCGAAAREKRTLVVNDVATDPRYLSGSEHTKSEIIVPLLVAGQVVGEFDINSYFKDTWDFKERQFVERCAGLVVRQW